MPKSYPHAFFSKVAGASHDNPDGSSRQKIIAKWVKPGMELGIVRELDNPVDPNAIALTVTSRPNLLFKSATLQIGYLPSRTAEEVSNEIKAGRQVTVHVTNLTGGTPDKPTRGVNLEIIINNTKQ